MKRLPALSVTAALFGVRTEDDIVVLTNLGGRSSFGNAAATERYGAEASVSWRPIDSLSLHAALATIRATYSEPFAVCQGAPCTRPTLVVPAGNRLPGVPAETLFIRAVYRTQVLDFGAEWRAQSRLPVDDRNSDFAAGWGTVNLSVQRPLVAGSWKRRAFFRIDNLLDAGYIGSVIVNEANGRFFEPAPEAQTMFFTAVMAMALQLPGAAHAGVYSDDLGKCLVKASSQQEKQQLVQWIFNAISLNPSIKPYANITLEQRIATDKQVAALFEKLLGESCVNEAQQAMKYEGASAFKDSFNLLGQVAGREMFASPEVAAGAESFTNYVDVKKLQEKLGLPVE